MIPKKGEGGNSQTPIRLTFSWILISCGESSGIACRADAAARRGATALSLEAFFSQLDMFFRFCNISKEERTGEEQEEERKKVKKKIKCHLGHFSFYKLSGHAPSLSLALSLSLSLSLLYLSLFSLSLSKVF